MKNISISLCTIFLLTVVTGCADETAPPTVAAHQPTNRDAAHPDQRGALHEGERALHEGDRALHEGDRALPGSELHGGDVNPADQPGQLAPRDR